MAEFVKALEEGDYVKGRTTTFFVSLVPSEDTTPVKSGGFGTQRTEGRSHLEMVITGGDPVIPEDSELSLDPKIIKKAMTERKSHLDEIVEAGYQGNSNSGSSMSSSRSGFGGDSASKNSSNGSFKSSSKDEKFEEMSDDDDDDFPF